MIALISSTPALFCLRSQLPTILPDRRDHKISLVWAREGDAARESLTRRSRLARTANGLPLFGLLCLAHQFRPHFLKGSLQTARGLEQRIIAHLPGTAGDRVPISNACFYGWKVLQAGNSIRRRGERRYGFASFVLHGDNSASSLSPFVNLWRHSRKIGPAVVSCGMSSNARASASISIFRVDASSARSVLRCANGLGPGIHCVVVAKVIPVAANLDRINAPGSGR
jgi:hypothetical protein